MAPNLEENPLDRNPPHILLFMSPLPALGQLSDEDEDSILTDSELEQDNLLDSPNIFVPLEHNLRALLVKVTGTDNLERVTQLKLRVISRDIPLQHLTFHIPALRELILDGSAVSSFRDLGNLRNLKLLKMNRCGIEVLDGMLGFESLEELYLADNLVRDCRACAFLTSVRVIDLRRNRLQEVVRTLGFLTVCDKLEHIYLEGNTEMCQFQKYRQIVKSLLPTLKSLDGITYTKEECEDETPNKDNEGDGTAAQNRRSKVANLINGNCNKSRVRSSLDAGFTVKFPPNVISNRTGN